MLLPAARIRVIPEPLNSTLVSEAIETVFPASAPGTNEPKPRTATRERVARGRKGEMNFFISRSEFDNESLRAIT